MNIKDIAERAHNHAVKCGFYKDDAEIAIFHKVSEESEELMDAINNRRYCNIDTFLEYVDENDHEYFLKMFIPEVKNSIGDEMADNILMILAGAVELGINIEKHLYCKQKYNELREDHKHKNSQS